ncbi:MAG: SpoIIE family protein phosphatase [Bacteroidetes bacterium]|nr:SpoIIE family protein phosphatase [Bacteroidota bacterium]
MLNKICLKLLFSLLFLGNVTLFAQELKFAHITAEQGLSMGAVNCVLQDSRGFMWFGTQDGLNKYDGYSITVYKHNQQDSNSLANNFIYSLFEDRNGVLWIGTNGGGLDAFNLSTGKFTHYLSKQNSKNSLSNNNVRAILEDKDGILWIGTDEGLNALDRKTKNFTRYLNNPKDPNSISNNSAWCLLEASDGRIWIGTYGGGLNVFDKKNKSFKNYQELDNKGQLIYENANKVRSILEDKDGIFWIGTYGEGVQIFDPKTGKYLNHLKNNPSNPNSLINDRITSVTEDANGILWIGTYGGGIDQYYKKTGRFRHFYYDEKNQNSLNSNQIKYILHDKVGSVWVGTEGGGINVHFRSSSKFKYYKKRDDSNNSLLTNDVFSILEDREGILWIGTKNGGLTTLDRKSDTYVQYPHLSVANNKTVLSLCEDKEGLIWIGTWGGGLLSYDKRTKKATSYPTFIPQDNATIVTIYEDKQGLIWIGTYGGGLFAYNKTNKEFINYNSDNGLTSNNIYTIFQDSNNNIWVGTEGGGVNKIDAITKKIKFYTRDEKQNSISSNSINHIYEDFQGNIWFGTTNGLNKLNYKTDQFTHFFEKDGLPNAYIYCILPDKNGNLWMTTNKGISKFNPNVSNIDGSAFRNYDVNDGLQGLEHNQGAFFKSKKTGEIFVGGVNGFNAFFPEKIIDNQNIPTVRITSYKRFGSEVEMDTLIYDKKYIELSWRQNFFSFEFVALDYQMPGKNKYSFKLEGVDENWSPASTQRYASYTELRGGDYVFRVRAANNDGIWNNDGVTLHIRINPPFWQTKWFYTICVILVIGGFWGFLKYRTSAIKRENKILEEKVEERTQELAQKNKDITSSIQYAKRIQLAILPPLEQIYKHFPESFVVYKPKDIVSGDFYWFGVKNGKKIIATVDCTGHGVPGAFMSMIGHNLLNQIISENGITEPDLILNALHQGVQAALKQGTNVVDTSDGMDVALCSIDTQTNEVKYAGAYRPLYIVNGQEFKKIDADKNPIGGSQLDPDRKFTCHTIQLKRGDTLYMSSDGYADQFGGEKGKKFMVKRFNELLLSIQDKNMQTQANELEETFNQWKGSYQQVDDILVIGIRF